MWGKPDEQVHEETTAEYLQHTAEKGETVRERHLKRQAITVGLQSGVITFIPRGVWQGATCDEILYTINDGNTNQEAQGKFKFFFRNKSKVSY